MSNNGSENKAISPDEIIREAMSKSKVLIARDMYVVEGNPELNQLNIQSLKMVCDTNLSHWIKGKGYGWVILAMCDSYDSASEFCDALRGYFKDSTGKILI